MIMTLESKLTCRKLWNDNRTNVCFIALKIRNVTQMGQIIRRPQNGPWTDTKTIMGLE